MTAPRPALVALVLVVVGVAGCADSPAETQRRTVEIELEVDGGQRWSASGRSVDAGSICDGGSHRWVGFRMQDGSSPVGYEEAAALKRMQPALVLIETQLGCSDGTGMISIAWEPEEDDRWKVVGGSGAYSGATGGGRVEAGDDGPMALRGEISTK